MVTMSTSVGRETAPSPALSRLDDDHRVVRGPSELAVSTSNATTRRAPR